MNKSHKTFRSQDIEFPCVIITYRRALPYLYNKCRACQEERMTLSFFIFVLLICKRIVHYIVFKTLTPKLQTTPSPLCYKGSSCARVVS